jgi:methyl acetate hydrolase
MTLDTIFLLASMTKLVTSVAAMQIVEQGKIDLDEPLGRVVEALSAPLVLDGFDGDDAPILRPARTPLTLRRLLTHTSGFGHEAWSPPIARYQDVTGSPQESSRTLASLHMPLLFDPGERWEYGIGLEWVGKCIEAASGQTLGAYFRDHITGPLGMKDTTFGVVPSHRGRLARVHQREPDGSLRRIDVSTKVGEYESGGGGLFGSAGDYLSFLRMLLNGGRHGDVRILKPKTVSSMIGNHIGSIDVVGMKSGMPSVSNDFELFPGESKKWGLGALVNVEAVPGGRAAGSLGWGGVANCYYWLDPSTRLAGVFMTQVLPFGDPTALSIFGEFERCVYGLAK